MVFRALDGLACASLSMAKPYPDNSLLVNHNCLGMIWLMNEFKVGDKCMFLGTTGYISHIDGKGDVYVAWLDSDLRYQQTFVLKSDIAVIKKVDPDSETRRELNLNDLLEIQKEFNKSDTEDKPKTITIECLESCFNDLWNHASLQFATDYNRGRHDAITDLAKRLGIELREE